MTEKLISTGLAALAALALRAGTDWPNKKLNFTPQVDTESTRTPKLEGRTIVRYWHAPDPAWAEGTPAGFLSGLENPKRRDHFAVVLPKGADAANPPAGRALLVVLHGRNGGKFADASCSCLAGVDSPDSPFYAPPDAYAMGCDALANLLSDIWYGSMPPPKTIYEDSPGNLAGTGAKDGAGDAAALGMKVLPEPWSQSDYTHWGPCRYAGYMWESSIMGELFDGPRADPFKYYRSAPSMTCLKWNLGHENAVMKRILDEVEWVVRTYGIDRNRIYLAGNSMGGQAALAFALTHGEVFAAAHANVPATVWFPAARAGFVDEKGEDVDAAAFVQPEADPAVIFDWSGSDDAWSRRHDVLYRNLDRFRMAVTGWWGDFGHCGSVKAARVRNDLVMRGVDMFSIRRDRPYVVFSAADCNDMLPWPEQGCSESGEGAKVVAVNGIEIKSGKLMPRAGAPVAGQWNAWLRGEVVTDTPERLEADVWIASAAELGTDAFKAPAQAKADVSFRRLANFPHGRDPVTVRDVTLKCGEKKRITLTRP